MVRVDVLEGGDRRFMGKLGNHPSLAGSTPDPLTLEGKVLLHDGRWSAAGARLRLPRYKVGELQVNDRVALGLISAETCICAERVPGDVGEGELKAWVERWSPRE